MSLAPRVAKNPFEITRHEDTRVDPYYWLKDRDNEEVRAYLRAENTFLAEELSYLAPLQEQLFEEMRARIEETDISVPVRRGDWWYYERTREGLNYPINCRVRVSAETHSAPDISADLEIEDEQVILDENLEALGRDYLSVGVLAISPDDGWAAVGVDFEGDERHRVTVRPLAGQSPLADEIEDVYYGFAWAGDSRHFFYTRLDEAMRPWQLWRHEIGTPAQDDVLILQVDDAQYNVSVGRSRDDDVVLVAVSSYSTCEMYYIDAMTPTAPLELIEPRRQDIDYAVEHFRDPAGRRWWLKVTNEEATDFRLLARRVEDTTAPWRELIAHRPGQRLDGVDAFATFLATSERVDGSAKVRIVALHEGEDPFGPDLLARATFVDGGPGPATVGLSANAMYETTSLRVSITSMVTPRLVAEVDVLSGAVTVLKQQRVLGGYDADLYVTGRLWVEASDGVMIPVSVVARRGVVRVEDNGDLAAIAPGALLLEGYGSYEISLDPTFSSLRLSLLDRGVVFAIAHVRGGGEMGRAWYEMGKLAQKPTTFSDFVRVAQFLIGEGWTTSDRLAARGGSAGGLLVGAAMNVAPDLFRCVVAEAPFVDSLSTMLDESLPLTVGEWEEWGNPNASAEAYRTMKSYSPYDNVRATDDDGSARIYPHVFAAGGLNDSRVGYWEPAKWVLKLRDANDANVAYLKTEMGAGHGGPSGRYDAWRDEAQILAYILHEIGAPA